MGSLETRVTRLEERRPEWKGHKPGWRSVGIDSRPIYLRLYGFDIEPLKPVPRLPSPCNTLDPKLKPIFDALKAEHRRTEKLRENLKGLGRDAQAKLAAQAGYRVIYPRTQGTGRVGDG